MSGGVFAIARSLWDEADFLDEAFTQREAWIWLIGQARWRRGRTKASNGRVTMLERGEFSFSVRFLADKWGWSKSRVDRFLSTLKTRDTLRDTSRDGAHVYFINEYNEYQIVGAPERDTDKDGVRDSSGTAAGQQRDKEEEGETGKKVKEYLTTFGSALSAALKAMVDAELKAALEEYNAIARELEWPVAQRLTAPRKASLKARLRECGGLVGWGHAMAQARASPFLRGDKGRSNGHEAWRPNLDFFLQQKSFTKLMEGGYDDRGHSQAASGGYSSVLAGARAAAGR